MTISFEGRVAVVTGAGGGIGRAHALEIARRGGKVVVNDLGGDCHGGGGGSQMALDVVEEIRKAGGTAIADGNSVATTEGANAIVANAVAEFGRLDVLINNAGIIRNSLLADMSDDDWDLVIATHLTGSFKLTRAAWPHMQAQGYGRLVYTCSSTAMFGVATMGNYAAAKGGIMGLVHTASHEGREHGILVNAILPNAITRLALEAAKGWEEMGAAPSPGLPPEIGNAMNPEFNMPIAVYLASEACSATHGLYSQCIGRTAKLIVGLGQGWQAQRQSPPSAEDIETHWDEICALPEGVTVPGSPTEELMGVLMAGPGA